MRTSFQAPFWATAPLFHVLLPLVAAIIAYDRRWLPASLVWPVLAGCLSLLLVIWALQRRWTGVAKRLFFPAMYLSLFALGLWRSQSMDAATRADWMGHYVDTTHRQLVKVLDDPAEKERIWRMRVAVLKDIGPANVAPVSGEAFLNIYKSDRPFQYRRNDLLLVPASWQAIRNSGNPFEVDYQTMHRRRNIRHQQFVSPDAVQFFRNGHPAAPGLLERAHQYCALQLDRYVKDSAAHGLLQAMLLGDESSFDPDLRQAYSETGVVHIVSISGSHVGVLFAAVALLLSFVKGARGAWLRFGIGLLLIWFYVLMAGAPPSAVRAALMFSIIGLGTAFSREARPLNTLCAAAVALLLANPAWLFSVGFQLSFGAVLSLILFYQPIYKLWPQVRRLPRWLWQGASASIAAEVLTAPLVIYYFHNFPLFFLLANLLAAVLVGMLALLGGMLIIALSWLPPLARAVSWMVTLLIKAFNAVIFLLQSWNPASFKYLQINGAELLLLYLSIAGIGAALLRKAKAGLYIGLAATMLLLILLCTDQLIALRQNRLVVYNVSRHSVIERIRGRSYYPLQSDTSRAALFAVKLAHTGWHAWRPGVQPVQGECFQVSGKRVVVLRQPLKDTASFQADVLIVRTPLKTLQPQQLMTAFHPRIIVADGSQPGWVIRKWKATCARDHIPFHAVSTDGAFVLE